MDDREFEHYLELLTQSLRLSRRQREEIRRELRAHLEDALEQVDRDGRSRCEILREVLADFGDAAELAARLSDANRRRHTMMQGTLAAACIGFVVLSVTTFLTPQPQSGDAQETRRTGFSTGAATAKVDAPNPADEAIRKALRTNVEEVAFAEAPLDQVFSWLADFMQVNVHVQWNRFEEMGVDREMPISVALRNIKVERVLRLVLAEIPDVDLGYEVVDGVLMISTQEELSRHMDTRVYDVHDLLANVAAQRIAHAVGSEGEDVPSVARDIVGNPIPVDDDTLDQVGEELVDLVTNVIEPDSWDVNGGVAQVRRFSGSLVVRQSAGVQSQVEDLLNSLRASESRAAR